MLYDNLKIHQELKGWDNGNYFGQWETDKIIEKYFLEMTSGFCIEVGAANGIKGSNTYYFEKKGWNTLCIEPNIEFSESLEKYRKLTRFYACSHENKKDTLKIFRVGERNIMTSVTSLSPDRRLVESHKELINETYEREVEVLTLTKILKEKVEGTPFENIKKIDFISVDTEGTELDVLKGFDFEQFDVKLFVIENNYEDKEIELFMQSKGYKKDLRYKINDFYTK